jgi:hypothetical protein
MYDPAVVAAFRDISDTTSAPASTASSVAATSPPSEASPSTVPVAADSAIDEIELALRLGLTLSSVFVSSRPWTLAADALLQVPHVAAAVVFRVDEARQDLTVESAAGECAAALATLSMAIGQRLSGWVAATGEPMINADAKLDVFDLAGAAFSGALAAPVHNSDGSRMVITLYSLDAVSFSALHLRLLAQVGQLVTAPPPWRSSARLPPRPRRAAVTHPDADVKPALISKV